MQHIKQAAALPEVQTTQSASHTKSSVLSLRAKRRGKNCVTPLRALEGQKGRLAIYQKAHSAPPSPLWRSPSIFVQSHFPKLWKVILSHTEVIMQEAPELGPAASSNRDFSPCCQSTKSNRQSCPGPMNLMSTLKQTKRLEHRSDLQASLSTPFLLQTP